MGGYGFKRRVRRRGIAAGLGDQEVGQSRVGTGAAYVRAHAKTVYVSLTPLIYEPDNLQKAST